MMRVTSFVQGGGARVTVTRSVAAMQHCMPPMPMWLMEAAAELCEGSPGVTSRMTCVGSMCNSLKHLLCPGAPDPLMTADGKSMDVV